MDDPFTWCIYFHMDVKSHPESKQDFHAKVHGTNKGGGYIWNADEHLEYT